MIETLTQFALFGSQVWLAIFLGILILLCIFGEAIEDGRPSFGAFVIFMILFFIWGSHDVLQTFSWMDLSEYFGYGILTSLLMTFINGVTGEYNSLKPHITRWIFMWPVVLLFNIAEHGFPVLSKIFWRLRKVNWKITY